MKLYIWEGDGISTGYHDDGTLIVLAASVEQAREIAIAGAREYGAAKEAARESGDFWGNAPDRGPDIWTDGTYEGKDGIYFPEGGVGGDNPSINREPDRVVDLERIFSDPRPQVVVFNGGGYD